MTPNDVSDELLQAVEKAVGGDHRAWNAVNAKKLIAAAINECESRNILTFHKPGTMPIFISERLLEVRHGKVVLAVNLAECAQVGDALDGRFVHPQTNREAVMPMRVSEDGMHWVDQPNASEGWYTWLEATTDADQAVLNAMYSQSADRWPVAKAA